ncbi:MAG: GAF domain-containing protein [bacterium]|nr:GAF domain-containing protein [bacterium]
MAIREQEIISALKEASIALVEVRDIDILLQRIVKICVSSANASRGAILLYDKTKDSLVMRAEKGYTPDYRFTASYEVGNDPNKPRIGLTTYVFLTKKGLHLKSIEEIEKHPAFLGKYVHERARAKEWAGFPLINPDNKKETFGIFKVAIDEDKEKGNITFSETEITIFKELANIASKAISISQQRQNILNKEIGSIIDVLAEEITLEGKLRKIVEIFKEISNAEAPSIWIVEGNKLRLAEGIEYYDRRKAQDAGVKYEYNLSFDPNEAKKVGLTAWIAKTGEKMNIKFNEELESHPQHRGEYDPINYPDKSKKRCNSFIGAPLQIGNQIIGVIKADNKVTDDSHPDPFFTEEEAEIFYYLAIIAAISIKIDQISQERQRSIQDASKMIIMSVSHRLRSILPVAESYLSYIKENKENVDKTNLNYAAEKALESFQSAMNIISEYEDFVKPQEIKLDIQVAKDVIKAIYEYLRSSFPEVLIEIVSKVKEEVKIKVNLDKIKEVFNSFVRDSKKMKEEELQIELVMISDEESKAIKLIYGDNGPGVPQKYKDKIFAPFFTTTLGGAGLGLTIAKQIITLHKGKIEENGEEGKGVRFEITLPIYKGGNVNV